MLHRPQNQTLQRNKASLIVLIMLAFLLMIGTGILVSQLPEDEAWQLTRESGATERQLTGFVCDAAEAQTLYPYQDGLIRLTPERVTCLDILGNERFAVDIDYAAPYLVCNGPWLLVADREGTGYAMLTPDGEAWHGRLNGTISGGAVSGDGQAALIQDLQDSTGVVTLLEAKTGRQLFDCHFSQSGSVLSVRFSPDGASFDVNLVNTDGSAIYPVLKRYSIEGNQVGQLLPELTDLYPVLLHDAVGNPVLGGYAALAALTYETGQPLWQQSYARIYALSAARSGLWVLAGERLNSLAALYQIDQDGQETKVLDVGETALGPVISDEWVAVGNGTRLTVLNSSGKTILEENMADELVRFDFSGDSLIIVTTGGVSRLPVEEP